MYIIGRPRVCYSNCMRDFLHHLFFPRESNNHRAKVLHHKSLFVLILLLLVGQFFIDTVSQSQPGVLGISANISTDDLLRITNERRQEAGQAPLVISKELSDAAFRKAQDMLAKNYWAHNSPDGVTPWVHFKAAGYDYLYAGENLARGYTTAPDVVQAWMDSKMGHRENMLSGNYKEVGFAVVTGSLTGDETVLVVEMLGSKNDAEENVTADVDEQFMSVVLPTPTVTISQQAIQSDTVLQPTMQPTPLPTIVQMDTGERADVFVASVRSQPLIDKNSFTKEVGIFIIAILLIVLVLDVFIIKRKKIVRIAAHSLDHIIFFAILLLSLIIVGKGIVL